MSVQRLYRRSVQGHLPRVGARILRRVGAMDLSFVGARVLKRVGARTLSRMSRVIHCRWSVSVWACGPRNAMKVSLSVTAVESARRSGEIVLAVERVRPSRCLIRSVRVERISERGGLAGGTAIARDPAERT